METKVPKTVDEFKAILKENSCFFDFTIDMKEIKKPSTLAEFKLLLEEIHGSLPKDPCDDTDEEELKRSIISNCILAMFNVEYCTFYTSYHNLYDEVDISTETKFFVEDSDEFVTLDKFIFEKPIFLDVCVAVEKHIELTGDTDHNLIVTHSSSKDVSYVSCDS